MCGEGMGVWGRLGEGVEGGGGSVGGMWEGGCVWEGWGEGVWGQVCVCVGYV